MSYTVEVSAPAAEPVSTADAKTHLRVTHSDEDAFIAAISAAAREWVEVATQRKLITQTHDLFIDGFPSGDIVLPFGQCQSVTSVKYTDIDDAESTFDSASYDVATWKEPARIVLKHGYQWPTANLRPAGGVAVRFVCGYGTSGVNVPVGLIHAIKLMIGHFYNNRESIVVDRGSVQVIEVPDSAKALAWPYRITSL